MALYYMMNKPAGLLSAMSDPRRPTVADALPEEYRDRLFPIGRLDLDTEGFLLFTDDGNFAHLVADPSSGKTKTYFFYAVGTLDEEKRHTVEAGVDIGHGVISRPAKLTVGAPTTLGQITDRLTPEAKRKSRGHEAFPVACGTLTVTEGKKHEVKRMLRAVGCHVVYLRRDAIGSLSLDKSLLPGEGRFLSDEEAALVTVPVLM